MSLGDDSSATIMLSGPVTLYESAEVRETLQSALGSGKDLRVDLETSGPWDLSGLQLLVATVASGRNRSIAVRFANVPGVCVAVAEASGLSAWLMENSDSLL